MRILTETSTCDNLWHITAVSRASFEMNHWNSTYCTNIKENAKTVHAPEFWLSKGINVSINEWQAGGAVSKVKHRKTPQYGQILFIPKERGMCPCLNPETAPSQMKLLFLYILFPKQRWLSCNIKTSPLCIYSTAGITGGQQTHFNWRSSHISGSSCVFRWLLLSVTVWRGNNQNNLGPVCLCGALACL